ncbi:hypothetical protein GQ473_01165, partial [archaeon]|nr:hypothetical protein [archaeon]
KLIKDNNLTKDDILKLDVSKKIISQDHVLEYIQNKNNSSDIIISNNNNNISNNINNNNNVNDNNSTEFKTKKKSINIDLISDSNIDYNYNQITKTKRITAKDYDYNVEILKDYEIESRERNVKSFVKYFNSRYETFKKMILMRPEMKNVVSLSRFNKSSNERNVAIIGMVKNIIISKNNNFLIEVEDKTGSMMVLVKQGSNIGEEKVLMDEVLGFVGGVSHNYFFAEKIIWADLPIINNMNKIKDPLSAVFISDIHLGSNKYLTSIEDKFIKWINSGENSSQNVKYLFISGDVVDGIGIYPSQENDLFETDIYKQYNMFEEFVEKIPEHIQIQICPGNHDAVRGAEPQPAFTSNLLPTIHAFKNVNLFNNPSTSKIHNIDEQEGLNVLMYHGYSFTRLIDALPHLRVHGIGQPQYVMKDVLMRRHLAPLVGATIVAPDQEDNLAIESKPDIFVSGDLHSHTAEVYKGVNIISASTFQGQTSFMDRVGHIANPGKVTLLELNTRKYKVFDFWNGKNP